MTCSELPANQQLRGITPVFVVSDLRRSAEFYRDVLGFSFDRYWGDPPCFVMLGRDHVDLFLSCDPRRSTPLPNHQKTSGSPWDAYIWIEDAASLLREVFERGARIVRGPEATSYNTIEFEVEDPDGHRLCFAQDVSCEL